MKASLLVAVVFSGTMLAQQVTQDTYVPSRLTLEQLMQEDATFNGANLWALAADKVKFRAAIEQQASAGRLIAQMLLGEAYIPPECTFLPYKMAPADCPQDPPPNNFLGLRPSFDMATHWLTLASDQGSGQASEILAQVMERAIKSPSPSPYRMTDVAHYHALARDQGFDLQDVDYSCYSLDPSHPADRLIMEETTPEFQFTLQELDTLHAAGASGTLRWTATSRTSGLGGLLQHPEGPKIRTRVILAHPTSHEMFVTMGNRVDVVHLQQGDRIVTIPSTYPALRRKISFHPSTAEDGAGAAFQAIDGRFTGGCASPTLP